MRARRSLVDLSDLTVPEIYALFDRAEAFEAADPGRLLSGTSCVNLFFEQSTRTFTSFNLAELRLGANVVNLWPKDMSLATKGETIEDTAATLSAMGVNVVVVRHSKPGFPNLIMSAFEGHVINAGDGAHAHPTQGLLDLFTIRREFGRIEGLRVALIGDIVHSRVANSTVNGLLQLGAEVVLVGPEVLLPASYSRDGVEIERDFERMLPEVDVVILLRIQRERFNAETMSDADFIAGYQLNAARLPKLKPGAIVMHPGPYNRGMELDDAVTEFTGWRYARQVHNGVYVRMAVLDFLVNGAA